MKVYVVTAVDHFEAKQLVCKVFSSKEEARRCEEKMLLTINGNGSDRYSRVEVFERTVNCPEMVA